jgi:hypothetical protein
MCEFVGEDDLGTFEAWIRYQGIDVAALSPVELETWQQHYRDLRQRIAATPKMGRLTLRSVAGEYRVAVAVEDAGLWLTLWVRRSPKGEYFVMTPRGNGEWNPHTSYHLDGGFHSKSYGRKFQSPMRQALGANFSGVESMGTYYGHGPKSVGAVCVPIDFNAVVRVPPRVLGPRGGGVQVDLLAPGASPIPHPWQVLVCSHIFVETTPHIAIQVGTNATVA